MTTNQIKAFLARRGLTVTEVGLAIGETQSVVSQTIGYFRTNKRVREKLTERYGITFSKRAKLRPQPIRRAA
jgi:hypothetical protein